MATIGSTDRPGLTGLRVTGQTLLMVTFTLVETLALGLWLTLVDGATVISAASAIGFAVLLVGFVVEHVLTDGAVNGLSLDVPVQQIVGISVSEALLWVLWLGIAEELGGVNGVLVAGGVLAALLVPQHSIEDNVLRGDAPFERVLNLGTVGFTLVEAAGATAWLLLVFEGAQFRGILAAVGLGSVAPSAVGLGLLAVLLFVEHDIGLALARRG